MTWVAPAVPAAYILTEVTSGMFYVGSTVNLRMRLHSHLSELEKGIHHNPYFQRVYRGWDNIQVEYYECDNAYAARRYEDNLLRFHRGDELFANIGTSSSTPWSEDIPDSYIERVRATSRDYAMRPENLERWTRMNATRSRETTLDYLQRARDARGPVTEQTRERMSESARARGISPETRRKMTEANSRREVHFTPEAKQRQRQACQKSVVIEGIHYSGVTEAAQALGINQTTVSYRLKSERFTDWVYS